MKDEQLPWLMTEEKEEQIKGHKLVNYTNAWKTENHDRLYITLKGKNDSFRGERNHQLYLDRKTNEIVEKDGKGVTRREYDATVESFVNDFS